MISAIVLTKDQTDMLDVCLASIKWVDEIIIVDDDSQKQTIDIAKKYTDKIVVHTLKSFAEQRNFALTQAAGDWVLYLDPDERITAALKDEMMQIVVENTVNACAIPRRNFFLGREMKVVGGWPDYVIRLLRKEAHTGWQGTLHEQPVYTGSLLHLKNPLIHLTHRDITSMTMKTAQWSSYEAELRLKANHPNMSSWRFFRILGTTFFDWYIEKGGYKGGAVGTIESIFQTFSVFFTYVRLWEMQRQPSLDSTYKSIDQKLLESNFSTL